MTIEEKRASRRKQTAEVFTPESLAQEMIDKIPDEFWSDPDKTLLEPACGDGVFVRLSIIKRIKNGVPLYNAIKNTYAVDIMRDNIQECRNNIIDNVIVKFLPEKTDKQLIELTAILLHNIKRTKDTLAEDFNKWKTWDEESDVMRGYLKGVAKTMLKKKNIL